MSFENNFDILKQILIERKEKEKLLVEEAVNDENLNDKKRLNRNNLERTNLYKDNLERKNSVYDSDKDNESFVSESSSNLNDSSSNSNDSSSNSNDNSLNSKEFVFTNKSDINNDIASETESDIFLDSLNDSNNTSDSNISNNFNESNEEIVNSNHSKKRVELNDYNVLDTFTDSNDSDSDSDDVFTYSSNSEEEYFNSDEGDIINDDQEKIEMLKEFKKSLDKKKNNKQRNNKNDDELVILYHLSEMFKFNPEYYIIIEQKEKIDKKIGKMVNGISVKVQKWINYKYETIIHQFLSPFMSSSKSIRSANIYELLQNTTAEIKIKGKKNNKRIKTELSRGYCLSIPELGDILILHQGDIILSNIEKFIPSMKIVTPANVILENTFINNIEVEATSIFLTGDYTYKMNSIVFKGINTDPLVSHFLCGLCIDKKAKLFIDNLIIDDAMLLNYGNINLTKSLNLKEGFIYNLGSILIKLTIPILKDIQYILNEKDAIITSTSKNIWGINRFINNGVIKVDQLGITSTLSFYNNGEIQTKHGFELCLLGDGYNNGIINGCSSDILIRGEKFIHQGERIVARTVFFRAEESHLKSLVIGQEGYFEKKVTISGTMNIPEAFLNGCLVNLCKIIKIEGKLELRGKSSEIQNHGIIDTGIIINSADNGLINGGTITVHHIIVQSEKILKLHCIMPELDKVETLESAKLIIDSNSYIPKLKKLSNQGNSIILADTPNLANIDNSDRGEINLGGQKSKDELKYLDIPNGNFSLNSSYSNLTELHLKNGNSIVLLSETKLPLLKNIIIDENTKLIVRSGADLSSLKILKTKIKSECILEKGALISNIENIYCNGYILCSTELLKLKAIFNGRHGKLDINNKMTISGRKVNKIDLKENSTIKNLPNHQIGIFNKGKIKLNINSTGILVKDYVGSKKSIMQVENGYVTILDNYINKGIIYSSNLLQYQINNNIILSEKNSYKVSSYISDINENNNNNITQLVSKLDVNSDLFIKLNQVPNSNSKLIKIGKNITEDGLILNLSKLDKNISAKLIIDINSSSANLNEIQNNKNEKDQEDNIPKSKINPFNNIHGNISLNAKFSNLVKLYLMSGTSLVLLSGTNLFSLNSIIIDENAKLVVKSGANIVGLKSLITKNKSKCFLERGAQISNIENIYNDGEMLCDVELSNLKALFNGTHGIMSINNRIIINGKNINNEEIAKYPVFENLPNRHIGLFNTGSIILNINSKGIIINEYVGLKNSILQLKSGYITIYDRLINEGVISSSELLYYQINNYITLCNKSNYNFPSSYIINFENNDSLSQIVSKLKINQYFSVNSCKILSLKEINFGINIANNGIIFNIESKIPNVLLTFKPIINDYKKYFMIYSMYDINIYNNLKWNVDLILEMPNYNSQFDLILRNLSLKVNNFFNQHKISTQNGIIIKTNTFTNDKGKIESTGDIRINSNQFFKNTGGGSIQKNIPEVIKWTTCSINKKENKLHNTQYYEIGKPIIEEHSQTIYRDKYNLKLDKAGLITSGKTISIQCNEFDNSFGIINSSKELTIYSSCKLINECGLIYSGGKSYLNSSSLNNGYKKSSQEFTGIDINRPIREDLPVRYKEWVKKGYYKSRSNFFEGIFSKTWVDQSGYEDRVRTENILVGYHTNKIYSTSVEYPGYIFSKDDIHLNIGNMPVYVGTIVSGQSIYLQGDIQNTINYKDRGTLIAKGDINIAMKNAYLHQLVLQARTIHMNIEEDLIIQGIIHPIIVQGDQDNYNNGQMIQAFNLRKFANWMGFMVENKMYIDSDSSIDTSTGLIPISKDDWNANYLKLCTSEAGFMDRIPSVKHFMPTIPEKILNQLLEFVLTPIYGREILINKNLREDLIQQGVKLAHYLDNYIYMDENDNMSSNGENKTNQQALLKKKVKKLLMPSNINNNKDTKIIDSNKPLFLPDNKPAILFKKYDLDNKIKNNNENENILLCDPYLLTHTASQIAKNIVAKKLKIKSKKTIEIRPGPINIETEDLTLEAKEKIKCLGEYKFDDSSYTRIDVDPLKLNIPGELIMSADEGIDFQGTEITAGNIIRKSTYGDITEKQMMLDQNVNQINKKTISIEQRSVTSKFNATNNIETHAPKGKITQEGTTMEANNIIFNANEHTWTNATEINSKYAYNNKGYAYTTVHMPKPDGFNAKNIVIFNSKDTTLTGIQIYSDKLSNPVNGNFKILPAYIRKESESRTIKNGGLTKKFREFKEVQELVSPSIIMTGSFESNGVGLCELESVILHTFKMTMTKDLVEKTAYNNINTSIHETTSGLIGSCCIKGDPLLEELNGMDGEITLGEIAPKVFNTVGTVAQTATHVKTLANLSKFKNPFAEVAKILMSRYISGFSIGETSTKITRNEKIPEQSQINVEILNINNEKTHLEGRWNIRNKGYIDTNNLTANSSYQVVKQNIETNGWSISFSPVNIIQSIASCGLTPTAFLPSIGIQDFEMMSNCSQVVPMTLEANELYIRCNNAVFKGSKIRSRLLDMIVTGDLTIESLIDEFKSESHNSSFNMNLSALANLATSNAPFKGLDDQRLGAIPGLSISDEKRLSKKVNKIAQLVGEEKFYLKVGNILYNKGALIGLTPDGVAFKNRSMNEQIEANKIVNETISQYNSYSKKVINPSLNEFFSMMSQINEYQKLNKSIEVYKMVNDLSKKTNIKLDDEIKELFQTKEFQNLIDKLGNIKMKINKIKQIDQLLKNNISLSSNIDPEIIKRYNIEKKGIADNVNFNILLINELLKNFSSNYGWPESIITELKEVLNDYSLNANNYSNSNSFLLEEVSNKNEKNEIKFNGKIEKKQTSFNKFIEEVKKDPKLKNDYEEIIEKNPKIGKALKKIEKNMENLNSIHKKDEQIYSEIEKDDQLKNKNINLQSLLNNNSNQETTDIEMILFSKYITPEFIIEKIEESSLIRDTLKQMVIINKKVDKILAKYPTMVDITNKIIKGIGNALMFIPIIRGAKYSTVLFNIGKGEVTDLIIEKGTNWIIEKCSSYGRTEDEAKEFGRAVAGICNKLDNTITGTLNVKGLKKEIKKTNDYYFSKMTVQHIDAISTKAYNIKKKSQMKTKKLKTVQTVEDFILNGVNENEPLLLDNISKLILKNNSIKNSNNLSSSFSSKKTLKTQKIKNNNNSSSNTTENKIKLSNTSMSNKNIKKEKSSTENNPLNNINEEVKSKNKSGRTGKQKRLKELMNDDKLSKAERGWLKQEYNNIKRKNKKNMRLPPGMELAHQIGFEAAKGYGYEYSNLQYKDIHKTQHKYDNYGKLNKDRGHHSKNE